MGRKKRIDRIVDKIDSYCGDLSSSGHPEEASEIRLWLQQVTDKISGKHLVRQLLPKKAKMGTWQDRVTYCSRADKSFMGHASMCPYCYPEEYKRIIEKNNRKTEKE